LVRIIVGIITVIRQWRGERKDGLRQGAIRRKTRLYTITDYVEGLD
jgi:hypothetical protein